MYTLAQLGKVETEPLRKGVILNLLRYSEIMNWLPIENVNSLKSIAIRTTHLPSVAFRKIGAGYTEDTSADVEQVWESVFGFGGDIQLDNVFSLLTNTVVDPKVYNVNMKLKSMAYTYNNYFINGDAATDPDGFEGLRKRISLMPARQTVLATAAGATALDPTNSAANARRFIDMLERAIHRTNGGKANGLLMNEGMYTGIGRILRLAASAMLLNQTVDNFGRKWLDWNGITLIDMGLLADQTTEVIGNAYLAADGDADSTEIYGVSFGIDEGIVGIQLNELSAYDPLSGGEMETLPSKLMRIDWWTGLAGFGSYGITRLWNILDPALWT